jgi:transcriptional regulator with XRE-family HTH domain
MRPSPHRHTLAVLRTFLGLTQKEMADLAECSRPTIQAIELGKLQLSEKLAKRIEHETGIGLEWLLAGDPTVPPQRIGGIPYSKSVFDSYQASKMRRHSDPNDRHYMHGFMAVALLEISNMVLQCYEAGNLDLCGFKLKQALAELRKGLGVSDKMTMKEFQIVDDIFQNTLDYSEALLFKQTTKPPRDIKLHEIVKRFEADFETLYKKKTKARS